MAIDTVGFYHEGMKFPLWCKITGQKQNSYDLGETYEIRVEDRERNDEKGEEGPYNYIHEAILIGKWESKVSELPNMLIAYCGDSRNREEALENIFGYMKSKEVGDHGKKEDSRGLRYDRSVVVLTFLRIDRAKDFVVNGDRIIPSGFEKTHTESGK